MVHLLNLGNILPGATSGAHQATDNVRILPGPIYTPGGDHAMWIKVPGIDGKRTRNPLIQSHD